MTGWFWWPLAGAGAWAVIWVAAARGYSAHHTYPRDVSTNAFGGPVREYVFPGGFIAALACLLTALLADPVRSYKPMANALQAGAILFTVAALLGLVLYQSLENRKSQDGSHITLDSFAFLGLLGAIYALLSSALVTILIVILLSLSMPAQPDPAGFHAVQNKTEKPDG